MSYVQTCKVWRSNAELIFPMLAEAKLDGVRAVCIENRFYSRQMKPLANVDDIAAMLPADMVWDGELLAMDGTTGLERWGRTVSILHGTVKPIRDPRLCFYVFDCIPLDDWRSRCCSMQQIERSIRVRQLVPLLKDPRIEPVEAIVVNNRTEVRRALHTMQSHGYEGLVLKSLAAPYRWKRTDNWLKLKTATTAEFVCVGVEEGRGSCRGTAGALVIQVCEKRVTVGSGLSDAQRIRFWRNPPLGKLIEVKYQQRTQSGNLRFPTFVRVREDLESKPLPHRGPANASRCPHVRRGKTELPTD